MSLSTGAFWILSTAPSHNTPCVAARKICRGAAVVHHFGRPADRSGSADHVVEDPDDFALDAAADYMGLLGFFGAAAAFVDDCQVPADPRDMDHRPFYAALVGADDHEIILKSHGLDVIVDYRRAKQVVHGDIEEALDLSGVEVHGHDPACAARVIMFATSLAVMGTRPSSFRSWRA